MLNGGHCMGSPAAGLAATWAAGWAALLVEGLARGLAAFQASNQIWKKKSDGSPPPQLLIKGWY
jgi:uncharacterized membrane protein HdeD (DUF308 family)